jgi:APA family basic amino acid/polyamine antiporter
VIVILSAVHSRNLKVSSGFQGLATWLKVLLIGCLIILGLFLESEATALDFSKKWGSEVLSSSFAIAFVFVSYSYTGWNAAAYIIEEVKEPAVNLPKALIRGTLLVTVLYVCLQFVFLKHGELPALQGQIDVGHVFASHVLGVGGTAVIDLLIVFFLISSISAMVWIGPRVSMAMGKDYRLWQFLRRKNRSRVPVLAIWFQAAISMAYVLTGTFESVLLYCGFILQISALLTVAGVVILRVRQPAQSGFRSPFYPVLPILFVVFSLWILYYLILNQPWESLIGLLVLAVGGLTYWFAPKLDPRHR